MKALRNIILALLALTSPRAFAEHTLLTESSDALRHAQVSHDVQDLQAAKKALVLNIGAEKRRMVMAKKKEALENVKRAMEALEAGNRAAADKEIADALKAINDAMGISHSVSAKKK